MNKRLKELAVQAGLQNTLGCFWQSSDDAIEHFAKLVRADEREAWAKHIGSVDDPLAQLFANAIRARGEPSPAFKNYIDDNWSGIV